MFILALLIVQAAHAETFLFDRNSGEKFTFKEFHHLNLSLGKLKTEKAAFNSIQAALAKNKKFSMDHLQGNPASYFCEKGVNGQNITLKDIAENEYAICRLSEGVMVDSWDLFRLKK